MTLFRSLALIPTDENLMITLTTLPTIKIEIWSCKTEIGALVSFSVGCMTTWSRGSHNLVSELDFILIGVYHKDNLYLGTSTIENGNPHPTNIDSWCEPRDHATHNQDWDLIPERRNRSDRSVTQWKPAPRHQHYWIE